MNAKPTNHPGEVVLTLNRRDESMLAAAGARPTESLFRLKKILVPVDFSDCSKKALQYALPLAKLHEAELTLLYVVPPPTYAVGEYGAVDCAPLEAELRAGGERDLAALAKAEVGDDAKTTTMVRTGSAADEIVELARVIPADMIVLSTHGRTGLKHVLLGSVAEHVVRRAPCPVLVVREREHEFLA